jgi:sarcosine oxidase subunit gamma
MAEWKSALNITPGGGEFEGGSGESGVRLGESPLVLWQIAFWSDAAEAVAARLAEKFGAAPAPGRVATADGLRLVRAEPLTWWVIGGAPPVEVPVEEGAVLDLSHGRVMIRVEGRDAAALLARFVSVDLREKAFPDGSHAATAAHHSQWNVIRRDRDGPGYDLLVGRSFTRDFWEMLALHGRQFGMEIV